MLLPPFQRCYDPHLKISHRHRWVAGGGFECAGSWGLVSLSRSHSLQEVPFGGCKDCDGQRYTGHDQNFVGRAELGRKKPSVGICLVCVSFCQPMVQVDCPQPRDQSQVSAGFKELPGACFTPLPQRFVLCHPSGCREGERRQCVWSPVRSRIGTGAMCWESPPGRDMAPSGAIKDGGPGGETTQVLSLPTCPSIR